MLQDLMFAGLSKDAHSSHPGPALKTDTVDMPSVLKVVWSVEQDVVQDSNDHVNLEQAQLYPVLAGWTALSRWRRGKTTDRMLLAEQEKLYPVLVVWTALSRWRRGKTTDRILLAEQEKMYPVLVVWTGLSRWNRGKTTDRILLAQDSRDLASFVVHCSRSECWDPTCQNYSPVSLCMCFEI
jgi:hypothetical protein